MSEKREPVEWMALPPGHSVWLGGALNGVEIVGRIGKPTGSVALPRSPHDFVVTPERSLEIRVKVEEDGAMTVSWTAVSEEGT